MYYSIKNGTANHPDIPQKLHNSVVSGRDTVCRSIADSIYQYINQQKSSCLLALDGYLGVDWNNIIENLEQVLADRQLEVQIVNISSSYKKPSEIEQIIHPSLECDPDFGFVFEGEIEQFFDLEKLTQIEAEIQHFRQARSETQNHVFICAGCGSAIQPIREYFDQIIYYDLTREELFNRSEKVPVACLGSEEGRFAVHKNLKRFCYIDSIILDHHKQDVLKIMDWYVDANSTTDLKIVDRTSYEEILSSIAKGPIIMKQLYCPVVWGGCWQKHLKKLPSAMPNSGQGSIVPKENSIEIILNQTHLDIPFQNLMWLEAEAILGRSAYKIAQGEFPLSYFYDDEIGGGHMAIQVHPDDNYIKQNYNEPMRQDESYYILHTDSGAKTFIGLKENADLNELRIQATKSERTGESFDYEKYVDSIPTQPGDFILIPAGTIHASGKNQVVIEIDWVNTAYTPGYTFHIYDYVRPDLNGTMRAMHINHAFNVIKSDRRTKWVSDNLKQKPSVLRKGLGWAEYMIGAREDMFFEVHRLEFKKGIIDCTDPERTFHVLTLVEGDQVIIKSIDNSKLHCCLDFPDTLIIPACMGTYIIVNQGVNPCKVVKAQLKL